jgi:sugar phosphate isomerase/epimerase
LRRRDFLLTGAAGFAGFSAAQLFAQSPSALPSIGLQLYTVRKLAENNLERTLTAVARAGYKEVEFAGHYGHPAPHIRKMLDDAGLKAPSGHYASADIQSKTEMILEDALVLGHRYVTVSWIDAKDRTPDGYRRMATVYNEAGLLARGEALQLAYHNHSFEFSRLPGGRSGYEILIAECPPENLALQADVFWMKKAGEDPFAWFARHPNRYRMIHAKDMGAPPKQEMLDVGSGKIDWPKLITAAKRAGVKHFFVEHDEPKDALASIGRSYRYLRTLK